MKLKNKRPKAKNAARRKGAKKGGKLTIREITETADGYSWTTFMVQGFRDENGKWKRRKFRKRSEAEAFVALKSVERLKSDTRLREVLTTLSPDQVKEAEAAFNRLREFEREGDETRKHTLGAAVEFYLKHQDGGRLEPVEFDHARRQFLDAKERGFKTKKARPRTLVQLDATLRQFQRTLDGRPVCDVTNTDVENFLYSLRSKDGKHKAATKTFNGYRADLNVFFRWCLNQSANDERAGKMHWIAENPVAAVSKQEQEERATPETLNVSQVRDLMEYVETYHEGKLAPYFALSLFAGLRTGENGELHKLAQNPMCVDKARKNRPRIDLVAGVIHIESDVSKTKQYRQVIIRPALRAWLTHYGLDILPRNSVRHVKAIRKAFNLGHDVLRHTFFSMHVAAFKSVGAAALEGGNTEGVLKKHYLDLANYTEGHDFWGILPKLAN
jgi:hypothetical protein